MRRGARLWLVGCAAATLGMWAASPAAADIHVTSSADSGAGSLRDAVALAPQAETIVIDGGVNPVLTSEIKIDKSLTIRGQGSAATTVSGGGVTRVFNIGSITPGIAVRIEALGITKGRAPNGAPGSNEGAGSTFAGNGLPGGNGGAILNGANQVQIVNLAVTESSAGNGGQGGMGNTYPPGFGGAGGAGGAVSNSGTLAISGSTFTSNVAGLGGPPGASFNFTFPSGEAGNGGAIANTGTLTVIDSTFANNSAAPGNTGTINIGTGIGGTGGSGGNGGAIFTSGILSLSRSTLSTNNAGHGGAGGFGTTISGAGGGGGWGGAVFARGTTRISNVTMVGNAAGNGGSGSGGISFAGSGGGGGYGGAIAASEGTTVVSAATLTANSPGSGGAPGEGPSAVEGSAGSGGAVYGAATVNGSVFAGNLGTTPNCGGAVVTSATDIAYPEAGGCTGVTVADPKLDPAGLADNGGPTKTIALLPGSAAVDAVPTPACLGPDGSPLTTDQRGVTRPQGPACDSGAFEVSVPSPPPPPGSEPSRPSPNTTLKKKPKPVLKTRKKRAKVVLAFGSDPAGASFECKLDKHAFKACVSPKSYRLRPGRHRIEVRAVLSGIVDPSPARARVKVVRIG